MTDAPHSPDPADTPDPVLRVTERRDVRLVNIAGQRVPDLLRAAADWLAEHDDYAVTGMNISTFSTSTGADTGPGRSGWGGDARPRLMHLLAVSLAEQDTGYTGRSRQGGASLTRPAGRDERNEHSGSSDGGRVGVVRAEQVDWLGSRAGAERVPDASVWSVDLAEHMLRWTRPSGLVFLRALLDEGGCTTPARLRELTGFVHLHNAVQTLNHAARTFAAPRLLGQGGRRLILAARDPANPRRSSTVHKYLLPEPLIPLFRAALHRIDSQRTDQAHGH